MLLALSVRIACGTEPPPLARLRADADKAMRAKPGSVMDKPLLPPSGNRHDYLSLAPYWWPDPSKPDGLPWINRDGATNPQSREGTDTAALSRMCSDIETLALAYHVTGHEPYAAQAMAIARAWFLDPATKMNPHLEYAQGIPGRNTGRGTGIIDTVRLIAVVRAFGWLDGSPSWTKELDGAMKAWFRAYLDWMLTSKNGLSEARAENNHGSWYLAQAAAYALFVGDKIQARKSAELGRGRIAAQIEPDGRQPLELKRTKSYSYSLFNLDALFTLAEFGHQVDVDLFGHATNDGRSLRAALDYVAPYFNENMKWPGNQISEIMHPDEQLAALLRRAANAFGDPKYERTIQRDDLSSCRFHLIWPRKTNISQKPKANGSAGESL